MTLRHPRAVLVVAALVLAALGIVGANVEGRLDPTTLDIPGTDSSRANQLIAEHFGDSAPFVILLRGPEAAVDRQGPELIRALRRDPKVTTLSPWDRGSVVNLRPSPNPRCFFMALVATTPTCNYAGAPICPTPRPGRRRRIGPTRFHSAHLAQSNASRCPFMNSAGGFSAALRPTPETC